MTTGSGQSIQFLEHLAGHVVCYAEGRRVGLARVLSVWHNGFHASIHLHFLEGQEPDGVPEDFAIGGELSSFGLGRYVLDFSAGYGINATLVYHPAAIELMHDRLAQGVKPFDLMRLARDDFRDLPPGILPAASPGGDILAGVRDEEPRCLVSFEGQAMFAHARNLPGMRNVVWVTEYPLEIITALCDHFRPQVRNLPELLLEQDRHYVASHPATAPTIARSAEELFARRPALAQFFHFRYHPYSLNAALSNEAAIRIVGWIGEHCGFGLHLLTSLSGRGRGPAGFNATWQVDDESPFEVRIQRR